MKRSKFSDSQILDAVKRVEAGIGVPDICRELGICTATFYKWRAKFGGMQASEATRLREDDLSGAGLLHREERLDQS